MNRIKLTFTDHPFDQEGMQLATYKLCISDENDMLAFNRAILMTVFEKDKNDIVKHLTNLSAACIELAHYYERREDE